MSAPSANELFRAAQDLIREGQPVFPCRTQGEKAKRPYTKNGFKDATTDLAQVKAWWRTHRDAAIGIPTGILYDVLDVDIKESVDGRRHLSKLHRLGLLNGCKRVVKTPSGGWHLYFKAAPALTNKARGATLGLDIRAKGGYVLAPPSYVDDGENSVGRYEDRGPTVGGTDEPLLWDLIVNNIAPVDTTNNKPVVLLEYERQASIASLRGWLSERKEGERNNSLHWAVSRCIDNNIDPHELVEVATVALGLPEEEVLLTINSALRRAGVSADDLEAEAEALFPG